MFTKSMNFTILQDHIVIFICHFFKHYSAKLCNLLIYLLSDSFSLVLVYWITWNRSEFVLHWVLLEFWSGIIHKTVILLHCNWIGANLFRKETHYGISKTTNNELRGRRKWEALVGFNQVLGALSTLLVKKLFYH